MKHIKYKTRILSRLFAVSLTAVMLLAGCGQALKTKGENPAAVSSSAVGTGGDTAGKRAGELPIEEKKQLRAIAENWKQWDMSYLSRPGEDAEVEEKMSWVDDFEFTVTDLDQDGYLEIMTLDIRGKQFVSEFHIYEVTEDGKGLQRWKEAGADDLDPKWHEYPMTAYYDAQQNSWHYYPSQGVGGCHDGQENTVQYFDIEMKNNEIYMKKLGWEVYDWEKDSDSPAGYCDAEGKEVGKEAFDELLSGYYRDMEKYEAVYNWDNVYCDGPEDIKWDPEDLSLRLEELWAGSDIRKAVRAEGWESRLSEDEKKQLRAIATDGEWYPVLDNYEVRESQIDSDYSPFWYMVTDLDRDGKLEVILSLNTYHAGTEVFFTKAFEVSGNGKKLKELKLMDGDGEEEFGSFVNMIGQSEVPTYWDEDKKICYYLFDNCYTDKRCSSEDDRIMSPMAVFMENNCLAGEGWGGFFEQLGDKTTYYLGSDYDYREVSREEYEENLARECAGMEKGKVSLGWKEASAAVLRRMNEDYLYEELAESYLEFKGEQSL